MGEQRSVTAGEHCGCGTLKGRLGGPTEGVDAVVNAVKQTACDPALDRARRKAGVEELAMRDVAVLALRDPLNPGLTL